MDSDAGTWWWCGYDGLSLYWGNGVRYLGDEGRKYLRMSLSSLHMLSARLLQLCEIEHKRTSTPLQLYETEHYPARSINRDADLINVSTHRNLTE